MLLYSLCKISIYFTCQEATETCTVAKIDHGHWKLLAAQYLISSILQLLMTIVLSGRVQYQKVELQRCASVFGFVWPRGFGMPLHAEARYCWCTGDLQRLPQNNQSSAKLHILLFLVHICHLWGSLSQSWPQVHTRLCDGHMMYQYVDRLQQNHDILYIVAALYTSKHIS